MPKRNNGVKMDGGPGDALTAIFENMARELAEQKGEPPIIITDEDELEQFDVAFRDAVVQLAQERRDCHIVVGIQLMLTAMRWAVNLASREASNLIAGWMEAFEQIVKAGADGGLEAAMKARDHAAAELNPAAEVLHDAIHDVLYGEPAEPEGVAEAPEPTDIPPRVREALEGAIKEALRTGAAKVQIDLRDLSRQE